MKIMKTLKTLKFWSKKKNKKKNKFNTILHHSTPPSCCNHIYESQSFQPSAPPLPSWLDYEQQTYNQHLLASPKFSEHSRLPVSYQSQFDPQEQETDPSSSSSVAAAVAGDVESGCSYQQYTVENPVYGVPVLPSRETERSAGAVGCVVNVGAHLFRCFFPCFRVRDARNEFGF